VDKAAEEFLSKISQEKFWKYLEVKACLLKHSEERVWKVAFIKIQLVNESKVTDTELPAFGPENLINTKCFRLQQGVQLNPPKSIPNDL
jgi:hypothetical protein